MIYGQIYPQVFPVISGIANYGNTVIPQLWNLNAWLAIGVFGLMSVLLFYLIDRAGLQRKEKMG